MYYFALLLIALLAGCGGSIDGSGPGIPDGGSSTDGGPNRDLDGSVTMDGSTPDSSVEDASVDATVPPPPPAKLSDFWNRDAYFVHKQRLLTPTPTPVFKSEAFNVDQSITVTEDGTWYLFHREIFTENDLTRCPMAQFRVRIVVRTSTDKGATWSASTPIANPTSSTCQNVDGDAFYDSDTDTWHLLYQCLGDNAHGKSWDICHSSRASSNPVGAWTPNPSNPVLKNGTFWDKLGHPSVFDEGTPDIVEKNADGSYHVTFHGVNLASANVIDNGYRGVAKVSNNFTKWDTINNAAIYSGWDTILWADGWEFLPKGGGYGTIIKEGGYYYLIQEASDIAAFITRNQNWKYGLFRSTDIAKQGWDNAPDNPISSHKRYGVMSSDPHPSVATLAYPRFFRDVDGSIYLMVGADAVTDRNGTDPVTGHHLFKLEKDAPLLDFSFRAGLRDSDPYFVRSDTLSRGRGDALGYNVTLSSDTDGTHVAHFNGTNSRVELRHNPYMVTDAGIKMVLNATIKALPSGANKSAFVAGQPGAFFIELYEDGNLCFWIVPATGQPAASCRNVSTELGEELIIAATLNRDSDELTMSVNGQSTINSVAFAPNGDGSQFEIGSRGPSSSGFYASPNMDLRRLRIYDRP